MPLPNLSGDGFNVFPNISRYRLLHLSSAEIKLLCFRRIDLKQKSADRVFALLADFSFWETIIFFFRQCFATLLKV
jgi:hypothetical protein